MAIIRWLACGLAMLVAQQSLHAEDFFWQNPIDGSFQTAANWTPLSPTQMGPGGAADTVRFNLAAGMTPYSVSDVAGENDRLVVGEDALTLVISDQGYSLLNPALTTPSLIVGEEVVGFGMLTLTGSPVATFSTQNTIVAARMGSDGRAIVEHIQWNNNGAIFIGGAPTSTGLLEVLNGARVNSIESSVGRATVNVSGAGSLWANSGDVQIGLGGPSTVAIDGGAKASDLNAHVGATLASVINVQGAGSQWSHQQQLLVSSGSTVNVSSGGELVSNVAEVSGTPTALSRANIDGAASRWTNANQLAVGTAGLGRLSITNGATVEAGSTVLGQLTQPGSTPNGDVLVTGVGSTFDTGSLVAGSLSRGTILVSAGGQLLSETATIADGPGSEGQVTVAGSTSRWDVAQQLQVSRDGLGRLEILEGGVVTTTFANIGSGHGIVVVQGAGSRLESVNAATPATMWVGATGNGDLTISEGGQVENGFAAIGVGSGSTGRALVTDPGSTWTNASALAVGFAGNGSLTVSNGAQLSSLSGQVGDAISGGNGLVILEFGGAAWNITDSLNVDDGAVAIRGGAAVNVGADVALGDGGLLRLDGGGLNASQLLPTTGAGILQFTAGALHISGAAGLTMGDGQAVRGSLLLNVNKSIDIDHQLTIDANMLLSIIGGELTAGSTHVAPGGKLVVREAANFGHVENFGELDLDATIDDPVLNAGMMILTGHTVFNDAVTYSAGGSTIGVGTATFNGGLIPGSGALTVDLPASAEFGPLNSLEIQIGGNQPGVTHDSLDIAHLATLSGTLDLSLINGFTPALADEFTILTSGGAVVGQFDAIEQPPDMPVGLMFAPVYSEHAVAVRVVPHFEADFDNDGDVDGDDLAEWRNDFGPAAGSDADADGDSDGHDFLAWQQQLGRGLAVEATAAVPEPASCTVAAALAIAAAASFRLKRRADEACM
jgi:T5SS/PEP-CTERM-associated repeat protein